MQIETIQIQAEFLFQLESRHEWICKAPFNLDSNEKYVWIDKNGNSFNFGIDFRIAEEIKSFPCKVYRLISISSSNSK